MRANKRWEQLMQENKGKIDVCRGAKNFWRITSIQLPEKASPASARCVACRTFSARNGGVATGIRHGWRGAKQSY